MHQTINLNHQNPDKVSKLFPVAHQLKMQRKPKQHLLLQVVKRLNQPNKRLPQLRLQHQDHQLEVRRRIKKLLLLNQQPLRLNLLLNQQLKPPQNLRVLLS